MHWKNPVLIGDDRLKTVALDLRDVERLRNLLSTERPDVVVHMGALGDVDQCERDKPLAWDTTVVPSMVIASWASRLKPFLAYLSTDYVFEGGTGGYREDDPPNPVNSYGLVKLMGEVAFRSSGTECAVVRASSIFGFGPGRKNFAKFLTEKMEKNEPVKALVDQYTSPSQATLLGRAMMEILEGRMEGVFHVVGEKMSRYEFALKVADTLGFNRSLVEEAKVKDMGWFAKRPRDSSLNADETKRRLRTEFYSNSVAFQMLKEERECK